LLLVVWLCVCAVEQQTERCLDAREVLLRQQALQQLLHRVRDSLQAHSQQRASCYSAQTY
jgi:hypothetical protein